MEMALMTVEKYFTIREVAEMLKLSERTIRRWIKSKRLRAASFPGRSGSEYRISLASIRDAGFEVKEKREANSQD
jgi:excisionase family DNA binding protein